MTLIRLTTFIAAPRERVFDRSLDVDLHQRSMNRYGEKIVDGVRSGRMELNDTVTWTARHLGRQRQLTVQITGWDRPGFFADEMVSGDFRSMKHEHHFRDVANGTLMIDKFYYEVPYGAFGRMVDRFYLRAYMTRLLTERNAVLKKECENERMSE